MIYCKSVFDLKKNKNCSPVPTRVFVYCTFKMNCSVNLLKLKDFRFFYSDAEVMNLLDLLTKAYTNAFCTNSIEFDLNI